MHYDSHLQIKPRMLGKSCLWLGNNELPTRFSHQRIGVKPLCLAKVLSSRKQSIKSSSWGILLRLTFLFTFGFLGPPSHLRWFERRRIVGTRVLITSVPAPVDPKPSLSSSVIFLHSTVLSRGLIHKRLFPSRFRYLINQADKSRGQFLSAALSRVCARTRRWRSPRLIV